jgi:hypothetical protein
VAEATSEVVVSQPFPELWISNNGLHNIMPHPYVPLRGQRLFQPYLPEKSMTGLEDRLSEDVIATEICYDAGAGDRLLTLGCSFSASAVRKVRL